MAALTLAQIRAGTRDPAVMLTASTLIKTDQFVGAFWQPTAGAECRRDFGLNGPQPARRRRLCQGSENNSLCRGWRTTVAGTRDPRFPFDYR